MLVVMFGVVNELLFFYKQKTAYEMRISDWSSDVCSSDRLLLAGQQRALQQQGLLQHAGQRSLGREAPAQHVLVGFVTQGLDHAARDRQRAAAGCVEIGQRRRPGARQQFLQRQIGRASCRERVCQYVEISVVADSLKKKQNDNIEII